MALEANFARRAAYDFSDLYERRQSDRWGLADICALVDTGGNALALLRDELGEQHGISVTLQTLRNYARVAKSFAEEHRHYQYKWSNYLEWSRWDNPIEAMEKALDGGFSPGQMRELRTGKREQKPKCEVCGGDLGHCHHENLGRY